MMTTR
jgi:hypothetical protein